MIKKISFALFIILASPFVIALFLKTEYQVEQSVVINQPKDRVFGYIVQLKNQDNFDDLTFAEKVDVMNKGDKVSRKKR